jgi:hypothetical protein
MVVSGLAVVTARGEAPSVSGVVVIVFVLLNGLVFVVHHCTAAGRETWERDARRDVAVRFALRHHAGVGAVDREEVTATARRRRRWIPVGMAVAALLTARFVVEATGEDLDTADMVVLVALVTCLWSELLWVGIRRWREAVRWLGRPLPGDRPED